MHHLLAMRSSRVCTPSSTSLTRKVMPAATFITCARAGQMHILVKYTRWSNIRTGQIHILIKQTHWLNFYQCFYLQRVLVKRVLVNEYWSKGYWSKGTANVY